MADIVGTLATGNTLSGNLNAVLGKDGASAYELAVANGFEGTEEEWLSSIPEKAAEEVVKEFEENGEFVFCGGDASGINEIFDVANLLKQLAVGVGVEDDSSKGCYYRMVGDIKEWINPPSVLNTEYRTTERWNDKPVYTMLMDCGEAADKKTITMPSGVSGIIRFAGKIGGSVVPQANNNDWNNEWSAQIAVSTVSSTIRCGSSLTGFQTYLQIWYIKGDS